MPLDVITGPFDALEEALAERLTARPPGLERRVAVVTASRRMAERLQRALVLERGAAHLNLRFLTLHQLAFDVLRNGADPGPAVVNDDLFHERLMADLLTEEGMPRERALSLAAAHWSTARDLIEAGVDGRAFREHFGDLELPGAPKLERILRLADLHRDRLSALGVATAAGLARRAADRLEADPGALDAADDYHYYGFYDLNGAQSEFFEAVVRRARVTAYFPCEPGRPASVFAERFLDLKLRGLARTIEARTSPAPCALGGAAEALFDPVRSAAPSGRVRVLSASGERDEVWRVAKEILRLREGDAPPDWEEIGVVARGTEPYAAALSDLFAEHGIPHSIDDGGPLSASPAARLAVDFLRLVRGPQDREVLRRLFESPALAPRSELPDRPAALRYLALCGPRLPERPTPSEPDRLPVDLSSPAAPAGFEEAVARWSGWASGPPGWRSWSDAARALWSGWCVASEPDREAVAAVWSSLAVLDRVSPPADFDDFADTAESAFRRARRPGTGAVRGVRVLGAMDARGERFSHLFLLGLKEGFFPRRVREDPLLSDEHRRLLRDPGGYWILPKLEGYDEEKGLFALIARSADRELILSYSRSRPDGRAEIASLYLRELLRSIGGLEAEERTPRAPLDKWAAVDDRALTPREAALDDLLRGAGTPASARPVRARARALNAGGAPGPFDGVTGPLDAHGRRLRESGLSPSALEMFVDCPFSYFLARAVRVDIPEPLFDGDRPRPAVLGRVQHEVLRRVYEPLREGALPSPTEAAAAARRHAAEIFAAMSGRGVPALLWAVVAEESAARIAAFVERDVAALSATGDRPALLEFALTGRGAFEPPWRGRLDRVDWNPRTREYEIVDYKTRPARSALSSRVAKGLVHQAPAYLELLGQSEPWSSRPARGVRYEYLNTGEAERFTSAEWAAVREAVRARQSVLVGDILGGRFPIRPSDGPGGACARCPFDRACRKAHPGTRRRAERAAEARA